MRATIFRNPEHALRDQRSHDVAVVAVGDRDEAVGPLGPGALEHVVVDPGPDLDPAAERGPKRLNAAGFSSTTTTSCFSATSSFASVDPTRQRLHGQYAGADELGQVDYGRVAHVSVWSPERDVGRDGRH